MNQPGMSFSPGTETEAGTEQMEASPLKVQRPRRPFGARLARWGLMSVIFVAGGVAGYCVGTAQLMRAETPSSAAISRPERFTEYLLAALKKDLSLTEAQYPEVETILRRHHKAFDDLRMKFQPLFDKEMAQMERELQKVLDASQWKQYQERMERMRSRRHRPPSGSSSRGPGRDGSSRDGRRGPPSRGKPSERAGQDPAQPPAGEKVEKSVEPPSAEAVPANAPATKPAVE